MFCAIYQSSKQPLMYLYVERRDDFSRVPAALLAQFVRPRLVMLLPLDRAKTLANADIVAVKQALTDQGYYLQMPPPVENLLQKHLLQKYQAQVKPDH